MTAFEMFFKFAFHNQLRKNTVCCSSRYPTQFPTSAFMVLSWVLRYAQILFQRSATLPIVSSLIQSLAQIASMSGALMAESINSINTVDSPASLEVLTSAGGHE